jgi:ribosome-binding protein aMBF1 (putative translation factor)
MIENGLIESREDEKKRLAKALGVKTEEIFSAEGDESGKTSQG